MTDSQFDDLVEHDGFLEWAHVHGHRYGTPRLSVEQVLARQSLILEIDPPGRLQRARQHARRRARVHRARPASRCSRSGLRGRGTEDEEELEHRLGDVRSFMEAAPHYDEVVVNDKLDDTIRRVLDIMKRYETS